MKKQLFALFVLILIFAFFTWLPFLVVYLVKLASPEYTYKGSEFLGGLITTMVFGGIFGLVAYLTITEKDNL